MASNFERVIAEAEKLSRVELVALEGWLQNRLATLQEEPEIVVKPGREVVEQRKQGSRTLQLEYVKCGKAGCKCTKGQGHGPYWYEYWSQAGKTRSRYIGKKLPKQEQEAQEQPEEEQG